MIVMVIIFKSLVNQVINNLNIVESNLTSLTRISNSRTTDVVLGEWNHIAAIFFSLFHFCFLN